VQAVEGARRPRVPPREADAHPGGLVECRVIHVFGRGQVAGLEEDHLRAGGGCVTECGRGIDRPALRTLAFTGARLPVQPVVRVAVYSDLHPPPLVMATVPLCYP